MNRSPEQLHALVRYRLQQAVETLREASLLLDQSAWRGAQNRAYYAMFYAVHASWRPGNWVPPSTAGFWDSSIANS